VLSDVIDERVEQATRSVEEVERHELVAVRLEWRRQDELTTISGTANVLRVVLVAIDADPRWRTRAQSSTFLSE
jgi:hypothetical protein